METCSNPDTIDLWITRSGCTNVCSKVNIQVNRSHNILSIRLFVTLKGISNFNIQVTKILAF